jgi:uncharacterized membrane protein YebE (DUF533 family)
MDLNIGRDTLLALAAIAWADGSLAPEEATSIRAAAQQLALSVEDAAALEQALARPFTLDSVETIGMTRLTRLFTYAVSSWVITLDGDVSPAERTALELMGDRLGLSAIARERARSLAESLARETSSTSHYDLVKLRALLSARLIEIGDE